MNHFVQSDGSDGFVLAPHLTPTGLDGFVDTVVPLLQERGVLRTEYETTTLRGPPRTRPPPDRSATLSEPSLPEQRPAEVAIVGAGPTASSLVERLVANVPGLIGERPFACT